MDDLRRGQAIEGEGLASDVADRRGQHPGPVGGHGEVAGGIAATRDGRRRQSDLEPELVAIAFETRRQIAR